MRFIIAASDVLPLVHKAVWKVLAAVGGGATHVAFPAVRADSSRLVADVVAATAVLVFLALLLQTQEIVGQEQPGLLPEKDNKDNADFDCLL